MYCGPFFGCEEKFVYMIISNNLVDEFMRLNVT